MRMLKKMAARPWLLIVIGAVISIFSYLQTLHYPFISDDPIYISNNAKLAALPASEIWRLLVEPFNKTFEFLPLRTLTYWMEIKLFGTQNPLPFRLDNIFIYAATLPLVYLTTKKLWEYFKPTELHKSALFASIVTALFSVHPALVESIVWVSGRKYILPNLFAMLAFYFAVQVKKGSQFSQKYVVLTIVAMACVMLSKTSFVGVAPIITILWAKFWLDIPPTEREFKLLLPSFAVLGVSIALLIIFINKNNGFDSAPYYFGMETISKTFAILGGLLWLCVTPQSRQFIHPLFENPWFYQMVLAGVAVAFGAIYGFVKLCRSNSLSGYALIAFVLLCLPYLQLLPGRPPSLIADRYISLAIWPIIMLIVLFAMRYGRGVRLTVLFTVALAWSAQTIERPKDWVDPASWIYADYQTYPTYYLTTYIVVNGLAANNKHEEAYRVANTIKHLESKNVLLNLVALDYEVKMANHSTAHVQSIIKRFNELEQMLSTLPEQSKWDTPMQHMFATLRKTILKGAWKNMVKAYPENVEVRYNAGLFLMAIQDYENGRSSIISALNSPSFPTNWLGTAYMQLGNAALKAENSDVEKAEVLLNLSLQQTPPNLQAHCLLMGLYRKKGDAVKAQMAADKCGK